MISPEQSNLAEIRAEAELKKVLIKRKAKFDKSDKETQTEHLASLSFLLTSDPLTRHDPGWPKPLSFRVI